MNLLTDAYVLGIGANSNLVGSWTVDGTLIGSFEILANTNGKKGSIAASKVDNRIYVTAGSGNHIQVYDEEGTHIITVDTEASCQALYVPEAGKFWAAIHADGAGEIREYDTNGIFQSVVAELTATGGGYIEGGYGMFRYSGFLYYLSLRGSGFEANSGVYKDDLSNTDVSSLVLAVVADSGDQPRRFGMSPNGDFFVMDQDVSHTYRTVIRFNSSGVSQHEYVIMTDGSMGGLAIDQEGAFILAGDTENSLIYVVNVEDSSKTSFSATINEIAVCSALCTPLGATSVEDSTLSGSCPINHRGTIGESYIAQINAIGGVPPYTYVITGGALPPGLTLDPNTGVISGIPTTAGLYTYTVTISDSA